MRIIKNLLILSVIFASSCVSDDFYGDLPLSPEDGEYQYTSSSIYRSSTNEITHQGSSIGTVRNNMNVNSNMKITPLRGWSYNLQISNVEIHILTDGTQVQSFRIPLQAVIVNDKEFNVMGTTLVELLDSDSITVIGKYDGVNYSNGTMEFGVLSLDLENNESVITKYNATLL